MPDPAEPLRRSDSKVIGSQKRIIQVARPATHNPDRSGIKLSSCVSNDEFHRVSSWRSCRNNIGLFPSLSVAVALLVLTLSGGLAQDMGEAATSDSQEDSTSGSNIGIVILNYIIIVVLVAASGLFSGLTLGLLGLDKIGLEIIGNGDDPRMAAFAKVRSGVRRSRRRRKQQQTVQSFPTTECMKGSLLRWN